jgi:2-(1,2-epoxy-1,2-dihydrophenyl)acetyl-CoA isomerase
MSLLPTSRPDGASSVHVDLDGPVATISLDRPETRNALDRVTIGALVQALQALSADAAVRVVVLTGRDGTFCSGDDLREAGTMTREEFRAHIELFQEVTRCLHGMPQPVIASIAGHARGGGLEVALACDLRIAADDASFACPEARWGLTITNGASRLLTRTIGETRARELVLLGDVVDAVTAERYGLVTRVVPAAELDAATRACAARLLEASSRALCLNKRLIAGPAETLEAALRAEVEVVMRAFDGPHAQEGMRAFRERRQPSFEVEQA